MDPEAVGEGQAQARQRVWARKGHGARPEETVAQCLGLLLAHSGLLFPEGPSGGIPSSISALLPLSARRNTAQGGVTQCLSHSGHIHGHPARAQTHPETLKWASRSEWEGLTKQKLTMGTEQ